MPQNQPLLRALGAVTLLAFAVVCCGRTTPSLRGSARGNPLSPQVVDAGDAAAMAVDECALNEDCAEDSICIRGQCVYFGECLLAAHCGGRSCEDNRCVGALGPAGPPSLCEINADCAGTQFCIGGTCQRGVECRKHAHCSAGDACIDISCVRGY